MSKEAFQPIVHELVPPPDPVACCEQLSELPYRVFLDSASPGSRLGRYSFLTADPVAMVRVLQGRVEQTATTGSAAVGGGAIEAVRAMLEPWRTAPLMGIPPFQGGVAGFIAYDFSRTLERLPTPRFEDLPLPDLLLGLYDWVLSWDHETSRAWLVSTGVPARSVDRGRRAQARAARVRALLDAPRRRPLDVPRSGASTRSATHRAPTYPIEGDWSVDLGLRSTFTHPAYLEAVRRGREHILAGDVFQVNLSQRFEAPLAESPWSFYRRLRARNPAPFAAFLELPAGAVLSASPERFLRVDVDGRVETRPIKGTRPRGAGPEHDAALGQALVESGKDRSENLMIVDLMRNDLSKVCAAGSVRAPELFALEHYTTVHHLVSTVIGELVPGRDALSLLEAAFPGGSITGAPKVRAMEIIAELEPTHRGVYCGSIGYWSLTGASDTSIAIRTAVAVGDRVYFHAGGGIVADSDPELEYRETLDKAGGIIAAVEGATA